MCRVSDLKREKQIIRLLSSNKGYAEVAKKFGVSRQRIYQIADRNNIIGIRVKKKESRQILVENLKKELENGLSIREMSIKYNLSVEQIKNQFKIETSLSLFSLMVKTRNEKINNDFISGSTAKKIVNDTDKFLSNPVKVTTLDYVYMLNTKKGIKRYPKIGRRCDGGTFEDPKIINFIAKPENFVCGIVSPAGSGKSTALIQKMMEQNSRVFVSEPTIPAAEGLYRYMGPKIGVENVGFAAEGNINYTVEFFNPSTPMDYYQATSQNINDKISVAGQNVNGVQYTDVMWHMMSNPTRIINSKIVITAPNDTILFAQRDFNFGITQKDLRAYTDTEPINIPQLLDKFQFQSNILAFNFQNELNRPYVPDGMDILRYTILAGCTVSIAFYYEQKMLKKYFYKDLRDNKHIL
jgi:transposase